MSKTAKQIIEFLEDEANFLFDNKKIGAKAYKKKVDVVNNLKDLLKIKQELIIEKSKTIDSYKTKILEFTKAAEYKKAELNSNDFKAVYYFAKLSGINPDNVLILSREPSLTKDKKYNYNTKKLAAELKTIYELNPGRIFKPWELQKVIAIKNIFVNGPGEQPPEPGQYITTEQNQSIKFQI